MIVIIGHDDPETEFVAREAAARYPRIVRVVMDYHLPKNKPKALNTALRKCRGDIVGVFDAEDEVHPGLLRLVEARFEESGDDVVQAGVQLMNIQTSWWSGRNCLEYYFWFPLPPAFPCGRTVYSAWVHDRVHLHRAAAGSGPLGSRLPGPGLRDRGAVAPPGAHTWPSPMTRRRSPGKTPPVRSLSAFSSARAGIKVFCRRSAKAKLAQAA